MAQHKHDRSVEHRRRQEIIGLGENMQGYIMPHMSGYGKERGDWPGGIGQGLICMAYCPIPLFASYAAWLPVLSLGMSAKRTHFALSLPTLEEKAKTLAAH